MKKIRSDLALGIYISLTAICFSVFYTLLYKHLEAEHILGASILGGLLLYGMIREGLVRKIGE